MKILIFILVAMLNIVPGGKAYLKKLQPRDSIIIADQIEYGFQLDSVKAGTGLALPDFGKAAESDTLVLVRNWQIDTVKTFAQGHGKSRIKYYNIRGSIILSPFEEGHYKLPVLAVRRTLAGGQVDTLTFDPMELDVKTMPVDTTKFKPHDIKGQINYPITFREILPWLAGAWLLITLGIFLWALLNTLKSRKSGEIASHKDPAYIVALRQLDKYRGEKYWAPEHQKAYYSGITDTLKAYMEDRFKVDAPEMTTAELFDALKDDKDISPELFNEVRDLFVTADFVKFAKHTVTDDENAKALPLAVRFVTSTYQQELEEEQGKENVL